MSLVNIKFAHNLDWQSIIDVGKHGAYHRYPSRAYHFEIGASTATLLIWPNYHGLLVNALTEFYCTQL